MSTPLTVDDLREKLFAAIDAVRTGAISCDQARQIGDLAQVVVNSAKVEVEHLRLVDGARSKFLPAPDNADPAPAATWPPGITGVRRHKLEG